MSTSFARPEAAKKAPKTKEERASAHLAKALEYHHLITLGLYPVKALPQGVMVSVEPSFDLLGLNSARFPMLSPSDLFTDPEFLAKIVGNGKGQKPSCNHLRIFQQSSL